MILIDGHGNKLEIAERCPECGSWSLLAESYFGATSIGCGRCDWSGAIWDLTAFVEELPVEREP